MFRLGYFIPDYTAYEDLLTAFRWITPVLVANTAESNMAIAPEELDRRVEALQWRGVVLA
jgi:hypothetical protein